MLARLLLEMQGATLSLWDDDARCWSACVVFCASTVVRAD
jgi:predicted lipoprotein with Yx(FWY)xxD motif